MKNKSTDTQNSSKFGLLVLNEAGQRLTEFCQENMLLVKNTFPITREMTLYMDIIRWSIPKSDYVLCSQRWRRSIQSAKTRHGANYGSDRELLIAKFRLKLKEVGKVTRPLRYDLCQIPYDYTVEVMGRFKGLDLRVPELWTEIQNTVQ